MLSAQEPVGWSNISCPKANARRRQWTIIDVRDPDEFYGPLGHIPGAILIPLGRLASSVDHLASDTPLLVVCRSGRRSEQAALVLSNNGFRNVSNLVGGMQAWAEGEFPRCSFAHAACGGGEG